MQIGPTAPRKEWTVLYYLNGDNDLREHVSQDLVELHHGKSPDNANVVATLFRGDPKWSWKSLLQKELPPAVTPDWRGRKTYEIGPDGAVEVDGPTQGRAGHAETLRDFLVWGMERYPARHYMVVVAGHGKGPEGLLQDHTGKWMPVEDFAAALKETGPIDVLALQACSMAHREVVEELRGAADFLVASPTKLYGSAYPHDRLGELLAGRTPQQVAAGLGRAADLGPGVPSATAVDLRAGRVLTWFGSETGLNS